jgi:hypothetical protein
MRLIDADALGVGRCSRDLLPADYCAGWNGMVRLLEKAPTVDAVEVVRCRDCIYTRKVYGRLVCKYGTCAGCILHDDFFCANGERRDHD